jgi:hypothetical protein
VGDWIKISRKNISSKSKHSGYNLIVVFLEILLRDLLGIFEENSYRHSALISDIFSDLCCVN